MVGSKKKRGHPDIEELLGRPFCYYCERDFDDLKILISHQKAKHFKCERCGRRLNTAGGLSVHMNQVHKETLTSVDNALGNRSSLDVEIFGMEGIPEDVVQAHNQRIIQQYYQAEADRRAATGNPTPGANTSGSTKKPKFESPAELKKRLAEHKARMTEQAAAEGSSGGNTPGNGQSPALAHSPIAFNGSPYAAPQVPYSGSQGANYGSFSQEPYAPPVAAYQQPYTQQPAYSPPGQFPPYSTSPQYPPQQSFPPAGYQQPSNFPGGAPQFGAGSPPGQYNSYPPPASHTPPQHGLPSRPPNLPQPPGLPQRPSFGSSSVPQYPNQGQLAQQHGVWGSNGWSGPEHLNPAMSSAYPHSQGYNGGANASSVDELVSAAAREPDDIDEIIRMAEAGIKPPKKGEVQTQAVQIPAQTITQAIEPTPAQALGSTATSEVTEKKSKKEKDKYMKMVYSDNETSPEEKMARLPRYAFVPDGKHDKALGASEPAVTRAVDE